MMRRSRIGGRRKGQFKHKIRHHPLYKKIPTMIKGRGASSSKHSAWRKNEAVPSHCSRYNLLTESDLCELHVQRSIWFPWTQRRFSLRDIRDALGRLLTRLRLWAVRAEMVKSNLPLTNSYNRRQQYRKGVYNNMFTDVEPFDDAILVSSGKTGARRNRKCRFGKSKYKKSNSSSFVADTRSKDDVGEMRTDTGDDWRYSLMHTDYCTQVPSKDRWREIFSDEPLCPEYRHRVSERMMTLKMDKGSSLSESGDRVPGWFSRPTSSKSGLLLDLDAASLPPDMDKGKSVEYSRLSSEWRVLRLCKIPSLHGTRSQTEAMDILVTEEIVDRPSPPSPSHSTDPPQARGGLVPSFPTHDEKQDKTTTRYQLDTSKAIVHDELCGASNDLKSAEICRTKFRMHSAMIKLKNKLRAVKGKDRLGCNKSCDASTASNLRVKDILSKLNENDVHDHIKQAWVDQREQDLQAEKEAVMCRVRRWVRNALFGKRQKDPDNDMVQILSDSEDIPTVSEKDANSCNTRNQDSFGTGNNFETKRSGYQKFISMRKTPKKGKQQTDTNNSANNKSETKLKSENQVGNFNLMAATHPAYFEFQEQQIVSIPGRRHRQLYSREWATSRSSSSTYVEFANDVVCVTDGDERDIFNHGNNVSPRAEDEKNQVEASAFSTPLSMSSLKNSGDPKSLQDEDDNVSLFSGYDNFNTNMDMLSSTCTTVYYNDKEELQEKIQYVRDYSIVFKHIRDFIRKHLQNTAPSQTKQREEGAKTYLAVPDVLQAPSEDGKTLLPNGVTKNSREKNVGKSTDGFIPHLKSYDMGAKSEQNDAKNSSSIVTSEELDDCQNFLNILAQKIPEKAKTFSNIPTQEVLDNVQNAGNDVATRETDNGHVSLKDIPKAVDNTQNGSFIVTKGGTTPSLKRLNSLEKRLECAQYSSSILPKGEPVDAQKSSGVVPDREPLAAQKSSGVVPKGEPFDEQKSCGVVLEGEPFDTQNSSGVVPKGKPVDAQKSSGIVTKEEPFDAQKSSGFVPKGELFDAQKSSGIAPKGEPMHVQVNSGIATKGKPDDAQMSRCVLQEGEPVGIQKSSSIVPKEKSVVVKQRSSFVRKEKSVRVQKSSGIVPNGKPVDVQKSSGIVPKGVPVTGQKSTGILPKGASVDAKRSPSVVPKVKPTDAQNSSAVVPKGKLVATGSNVVALDTRDSSQGSQDLAGTERRGVLQKINTVFATGTQDDRQKSLEAISAPTQKTEISSKTDLIRKLDGRGTKYSILDGGSCQHYRMPSATVLSFLLHELKISLIQIKRITESGQMHTNPVLALKNMSKACQSCIDLSERYFNMNSDRSFKESSQISSQDAHSTQKVGAFPKYGKTGQLLKNGRAIMARQSISGSRGSSGDESKKISVPMRTDFSLSENKGRRQWSLKDRVLSSQQTTPMPAQKVSPDTDETGSHLKSETNNNSSSMSSTTSTHDCVPQSNPPTVRPKELNHSKQCCEPFENLRRPLGEHSPRFDASSVSNYNASLAPKPGEIVISSQPFSPCEIKSSGLEAAPQPHPGASSRPTFLESIHNLQESVKALRHQITCRQQSGMKVEPVPRYSMVDHQGSNHSDGANGDANKMDLVNQSTEVNIGIKKSVIQHTASPQKNGDANNIVVNHEKSGDNLNHDQGLKGSCGVQRTDIHEGSKRGSSPSSGKTKNPYDACNTKLNELREALCYLHRLYSLRKSLMPLADGWSIPGCPRESSAQGDNDAILCRERLQNGETGQPRAAFGIGNTNQSASETARINKTEWFLYEHAAKLEAITSRSNYFGRGKNKGFEYCVQNQSNTDKQQQQCVNITKDEDQTKTPVDFDGTPVDNQAFLGNWNCSASGQDVHGDSTSTYNETMTSMTPNHNVQEKTQKCESPGGTEFTWMVEQTPGGPCFSTFDSLPHPSGESCLVSSDDVTIISTDQMSSFGTDWPRDYDYDSSKLHRDIYSPEVSFSDAPSKNNPGNMECLALGNRNLLVSANIWHSQWRIGGVGQTKTFLSDPQRRTRVAHRSANDRVKPYCTVHSSNKKNLSSPTGRSAISFASCSHEVSSVFSSRENDPVSTSNCSFSSLGSELLDLPTGCVDANFYDDNGLDSDTSCWVCGDQEDNGRRYNRTRESGGGKETGKSAPGIGATDLELSQKMGSPYFSPSSELVSLDLEMLQPKTKIDTTEDTFVGEDSNRSRPTIALDTQASCHGIPEIPLDSELLLSDGDSQPHPKPEPSQPVRGKYYYNTEATSTMRYESSQRDRGVKAVHFQNTTCPRNYALFESTPGNQLKEEKEHCQDADMVFGLLAKSPPTPGVATTNEETCGVIGADEIPHSEFSNILSKDWENPEKLIKGESPVDQYTELSTLNQDTGSFSHYTHLDSSTKSPSCRSRNTLGIRPKIWRSGSAKQERLFGAVSSSHNVSDETVSTQFYRQKRDGRSKRNLRRWILGLEELRRDHVSVSSRWRRSYDNSCREMSCLGRDCMNILNDIKITKADNDLMMRGGREAEAGRRGGGPRAGGGSGDGESRGRTWKRGIRSQRSYTHIRTSENKNLSIPEFNASGKDLLESTRSKSLPVDSTSKVHAKPNRSRSLEGLVEDEQRSSAVTTHIHSEIKEKKLRNTRDCNGTRKLFSTTRTVVGFTGVAKIVETGDDRLIVEGVYGRPLESGQPVGASMSSSSAPPYRLSRVSGLTFRLVLEASPVKKMEAGHGGGSDNDVKLHGCYLRQMETRDQFIRWGVQHSSSGMLE